jgi:hypothetical protein
MRTKLLSLFLVTLALCGVAGAQGNPNTKGQSTLSHVGGFYVAANYSYWSLQINNASSVPAASPATFILRQGSATLPDGRVIFPYVGEIVTIGAGSVAESVTLTAVSGCFQNAPVDNCTISGNTSNPHGRGELIASGTVGIGEAEQDAALNGGGSVYWERDCGPVTLNTGGLTTTITGCNVPQTFTNFGGSAFVNTTITTATNYGLGIASATGAFFTACTSLTAGQNCSQFQVSPTKVATGTGFTPLLITATGSNPGAGVVHVKAWGYTAVQANF